jgi:hypothetical protein
VAITPAEFKERFPEFDSVDDLRVQTFIDKALLNIGESEWGAYFVEGQLYLTAHFLALDERSRNSGGTPEAGPVIARKIGDVSVTFASPASASGGSVENPYGQTSYGQEYWRLVKIVGEGMVAIV